MIVGRKKKKASTAINNVLPATDVLAAAAQFQYRFVYSRCIFVRARRIGFPSASTPLFLIESGCGHSSALREETITVQIRPTAELLFLIFDVAASGSRQSTDRALFVAFNGWRTVSVCLRNDPLAPRYHRKIREPKAESLVMLSH